MYPGAANEGTGRNHRQGPRGPSRRGAGADGRGSAGYRCGATGPRRRPGQSDWAAGANGQGHTHGTGRGGDGDTEALYAGHIGRLCGENPGWIVVARVLRPRGNKGEVAVELLTDFPERLTKLQEVFLGRAQGESSAAKFVGAFGASEPTPIGVKSCWLSQNHGGQGVVHFAGVASINEAEKFRGLDVLLPFEQRVSLTAGQYFVADLIGCAVFEVAGETTMASSPCAMATAPQLLGMGGGVQFPGGGESVRGTPLLEVEMQQGELLIPLAEDICKRIDAAARRIEVMLPEGLRELN